MIDTAKSRPELVARFLNVQIPEELVARVDRALRAEGLEVREFVKAGGYRLEVANMIGGAPGVPVLLQYDHDNAFDQLHRRGKYRSAA